MSEGALLPPVVVRLMGDVRQLRTSMAQARTMVDGTTGGMKKAGETMFAGLAKTGRAVSLVGAGVAVASVKMAGDFQAQTMVLHTAAKETTDGLKIVRKGILDIASGTGTDWHKLTDGMYQVEKAGFRGADGLKVLKAAAQGAREENASLSSVTNAMTSVMASYHLGADKSVQVMNAMKTAAGEGKMTMEEFAGSLSTVLPIASANKISFAEVSGALATLTQHGTSAREGTQELANTIRNLAAPNNVAINEMQRLGISSTDVSTHLGKRGLTGTLDMLSQTVLSKMGSSGTVLMSAFNKSKQAAADANTMIKQMPPNLQKLASSYSKGSLSVADWRAALKGLPPEQANLLSQYATLQNRTTGFSAELKKGGPAAQTYTDAIKKMTGGATGMNTTLMLTGENMSGFKGRVKEVGDSYSHATKDVEGWKETQKLFNVQIAKAKQTINVLAIEIGTRLLPVVTGAVSWFGRHKDVAMALAAVIGGVLALSVVAYATKLTMSAVKGVASMAKLGASGVKAGVNVIRGFRSASAAASDASGMAGSLGGAIRRGLGGAASAAKSAFDTVRLKGMYAWDGVKSGASTAGSAVASFGRKVGTAAASAGRSAWSGLVSSIKGVGAAMKTASLASMGFVRSMAASAAAGLRSAAAWVAQKVALVASAVAEKAAAVAQWLLNAAMDANPIGLIILAIAALVAGIIWVATKTTWFQTAWRMTWTVIKTVSLAVWNALKTAFHATISFFISIWNSVSGALKSAWSSVWNGIKSVAVAVWNGIKAFIHLNILAVRTIITGTLNAIKSTWNSIWNGTKAIAVSVWNAIKSFIQTNINLIRGTISAVLNGIRSTWSSIWNGIKSVASSIWNSIRSTITGAINGAKNAVSSAVSGIGGFLSSIKSKAMNALSGAASWLISAGRDLIHGLISGISGMAGAVVDKVKSLASSAVSGFKSMLGISSPSKVFRQLGIYVNTGLIDGLTSSTARVKAATRRVESLLISSKNRVQDLLDSKSARRNRGLVSWVHSHVRAISRLQSYAAREDRVLRGLAARRDSAATRLKAAQKKLAAVQKDWTKERDAVAKGIMESASIVTASPDEGRSVNSFDVVQHMRDQVAKANAFAANLKALQKKGLRSDLVAQLASAGVDQAGDTAQALAAGTKGQVAEMNKLQSNMQSAANSTGAAVANSMYGAGMKSAQGLIKGLQSQEKAIAKQMTKIAKSMQTAIKRALGIRSPSRVFADLGQFIPQGLAQGISDAAHHATTAAANLAGAVTGAGSVGTAGVAVAGAGGGGQTIIHNHYTFEIAGSVATVDGLAKDVEAAFLRRGMRNPTTYPPYGR
ncbi:phage tail tape measure protein [Streptomyces sp. NBC_01456]|uniref:phage tail tape measure protein n=1 Tax=Streptomyces sp. NBC_01456 TaxID=2975868 RepID=UPI002E368714|nr:phage tail tape measure protein [Streptomyces sp. NBC_01456]